MAYKVVDSKVTGNAAYTAKEINQFSDNMEAGIPSLMTTKGDLVLGTGNDTATRLGVGANGSYLVAASGETSGAKWQHNGAASAYNITKLVGANPMVAATEYFDVFGRYNTSTGVYIPAATGYYLALVYWRENGDATASDVNSYYSFSLYNSTTSATIVYFGHIITQAANDITPAFSGSAIVSLTAGNSIMFYVTAGGGIGGSPKSDSISRMSFIRLGSVGV